MCIFYAKEKLQTKVSANAINQSTEMLNTPGGKLEQLDYIRICLKGGHSFIPGKNHI